MIKLGLEDFVDSYIEAVSEAVQEKHLSDTNTFYEYVFKRVSEKTGLSREEINSFHHPFHWELFLKKSSPLELFGPVETGGNYGIRSRSKNIPLEKTELAKGILTKHRTLLQQNLDKILQYHN